MSVKHPEPRPHQQTEALEMHTLPPPMKVHPPPPWLPRENRVNNIFQDPECRLVRQERVFHSLER